jgi:uncharacterized protein DUF3105
MSEGERRGMGRLIVSWTGVLAIVLAAFAIAGCGGDDDSSSAAHINEASGSTNEAIADEREGITPAPSKGESLKKAAEKAECFLRQDLKEEGNKSLPPGSPEPKYETDPPTSGDHVETPHQQADGAYLTMPRAMDYVAALDHGRVAIHYAPDLTQETQEELKGLYDTMYGGTLLFPDDEMNYAVAATAWTNVLGCPGYGKETLEAVRAFARESWGKYGSEPVEAFDPSGPTPREPDEPDAS